MNRMPDRVLAADEPAPVVACLGRARLSGDFDLAALSIAGRVDRQLRRQCETAQRNVRPFGAILAAIVCYCPNTGLGR
jgi:hypothetical protein